MDFTSLNFYHQCMRVLIYSHPCQQLSYCQIVVVFIYSQCVCVFFLSIHSLYLYEVPVGVFCPLLFCWNFSIFLSIRMPYFLDTYCSFFSYIAGIIPFQFETCLFTSQDLFMNCNSQFSAVKFIIFYYLCFIST